VAYGFDANGRLVWLDRLLDQDRARAGALCLRHGQSLTVPKGWWLDDRRVAVPELFRTDATSAASATPAAEVVVTEVAKPRRPRKPRKPRPMAEPVVESAVESMVDGAPGRELLAEPVPEVPGHADGLADLPFAGLDELDESVATGTMVVEESLIVEEAVEVVVEGDVVLSEAIVLEEPSVAEPNPLLEPSSPLLARAFSGVARTDGPRRRSRRNGTSHPPAEPG
jgi:hypothetical protein